MGFVCGMYMFICYIYIIKMEKVTKSAYERNKEWRKANPEKLKEQAKRYQIKNREKWLAYKRANYHKKKLERAAET